jgi:hypothetical protein
MGWQPTVKRQNFCKFDFTSNCLSLVIHELGNASFYKQECVFPLDNRRRADFVRWKKGNHHRKKSD